MIIAKFSKAIENLTNKMPQLISRDVQTNTNPPIKEPPPRDIMSELSSNSDGIQKDVAESSNTKQSKINLKQQLKQVRLQKKIEFNKYQSQHQDKISQDKDIYPPGTCVIIYLFLFILSLFHVAMYNSKITNKNQRPRLYKNNQKATVISIMDALDYFYIN